MIPQYIEMPEPILGCTHAEPYAMVHLRPDTRDGFLGLDGGALVVSYRLCKEFTEEVTTIIPPEDEDGEPTEVVEEVTEIRPDPRAPDQELKLEGEPLSLLRAFAVNTGMVPGDFGSVHVLQFWSGLTQEQMGAAAATLNEWRNPTVEEDIEEED